MQYLLNFLRVNIMADLSAIRANTSGPMKELSNRLAIYKLISGLNDGMYGNKKQKGKMCVW